MPRRRAHQLRPMSAMQWLTASQPGATGQSPGTHRPACRCARAAHPRKATCSKGRCRKRSKVRARLGAFRWEAPSSGRPGCDRARAGSRPHRSRAAALDDAVRLARIEYHRRPLPKGMRWPANGNAGPDPCPCSGRDCKTPPHHSARRHGGSARRGKPSGQRRRRQAAQTGRACASSRGHPLHAAPVVRPARPRSGQGQCLDVAGL